MTDRQIVREFICDNFIVSDDDFTDDDSILEKQIIDSTGILELVAFLEQEFDTSIADEEMVPANLDSVTSICDFVTRKRGQSEAGGVIIQLGLSL